MQQEQEDNTTKQHWKACAECQGYGKKSARRSKSKRFAYQQKPDEVVSKTPPGPIQTRPSICPECAGSGLVESKTIQQIDTSYPRVAIVGAGIGGVALAVACLHRGIPFKIFERDKSFGARAQGYGLTLQQASNAIKAFGIDGFEGGITSTRHLVHTTDGSVIGEWGLKKWLSEPIKANAKRKNVHIARQSLRSELIGALGGEECIEWDHTLRGYTQANNGLLTLDFEVGGGVQQYDADLLVGADGIRSTVRASALTHRDEDLRYLGCVVILGICPLSSLDNISSSLLDSQTVFQTVNGRERMYVMPYDHEHVMWQLSFAMEEACARLLSEQGSEALKRVALEKVSSWHSPVSEIVRCSPENKISGYPVYDRVLPDEGLFDEMGNATLIGDAAHPMSPFKGQGANQALLDALALARALANKDKYVKDCAAESLRTCVLERFERDMFERVASKVQGSAQAVELLHSADVLQTNNGPRGRGIH